MFRGIYICGVMSMGIQARVYQGLVFFVCNFADAGFATWQRVHAPYNIVEEVEY